MKISKGSIVLSTAGRDAGKAFAIIDVLDEKYVLIADGKLRKLDLPKKKKIKHLKCLCESDSVIFDSIKEGTITNRLLKKRLADIYQDPKKE